MARASTASTAERTGQRFERVYVWELGVRLFHWVNAAAVTVLFATGLAIADPPAALSGETGGWFSMARLRQVHFAAAYVFLAAFLWRVSVFALGNRFARSGFPLPWRRRWWSDLFRQAAGYLKLDAGRAHLGHNALAGLSYAGCVLGLGLAQILIGFALLSEPDPGGFWGRTLGWVLPWLGGSFRAHLWHHLLAWGFAVFTVLHLYIVYFNDRQHRNGLIGSIFTGFKFQRSEDGDGGRR